MKKQRFVLVYIPVPKKRTAKKIAIRLLDAKLIACANILPKSLSLYHWKGKLKKAHEVILLMKTLETNFTKVEKAVKKMHPYDCPCIVALPMEKGNKEYLDWVLGEVR